MNGAYWANHLVLGSTSYRFEIQQWDAVQNHESVGILDCILQGIWCQFGGSVIASLRGSNRYAMLGQRWVSGGSLGEGAVDMSFWRNIVVLYLIFRYMILHVKIPIIPTAYSNCYSTMAQPATVTGVQPRRGPCHGRPNFNVGTQWVWIPWALSMVLIV